MRWTRERGCGDVRNENWKGGYGRWMMRGGGKDDGVLGRLVRSVLRWLWVRR
jgi:hypothetical protein